METRSSQQSVGDGRQGKKSCRADPSCDGPGRFCAVTRVVRPRHDLIRFVAGPDNRIVADLASRLPGRGVWISCSRETVAQAVKRGAFQRSLKKTLIIPEDLADEVEHLLAHRARSALSVANKAGLIVTGFVKVERAINRGDVLAVVHAIDAAEDGKRKLDRLHAAVSESAGREGLSLAVLDSDEMSLALGRSNVVHAAVRIGGAAAAFIAAASRLVYYRVGLPVGPLRAAEEAGSGDSGPSGEDGA